MRIVGGVHKGKRLEAPADRSVRPTADRTRESLFNLLAHGPYPADAGPMPQGASVLDVFAGTGALGLEALSRGAERAVFLEEDAAACKLIQRNIQALGEGARASVTKRDAMHPGPAPGRFNLVLMDPPYGSGLGVPVLSALLTTGWLTANALVVVEIGAKEHFAPPMPLSVVDERRYGAARLLILHSSGISQPA